MPRSSTETGSITPRRCPSCDRCFSSSAFCMHAKVCRKRDAAVVAATSVSRDLTLLAQSPRRSRPDDQTTSRSVSVTATLRKGAQRQPQRQRQPQSTMKGHPHLARDHSQSFSSGDYSIADKCDDDTHLLLQRQSSSTSTRGNSTATTMMEEKTIHPVSAPHDDDPLDDELLAAAIAAHHVVHVSRTDVRAVSKRRADAIVAQTFHLKHQPSNRRSPKVLPGAFSLFPGSSDEQEELNAASRRLAKARVALDVALDQIPLAHRSTVATELAARSPRKIPLPNRTKQSTGPNTARRIENLLRT